jgi:hypothetical protein
VALEYASAIGAYVATQPGGCPDYDLQSIEALINSNSSERIMLI